MYSDKQIPIYGNGKIIRDWIFVLDHVEGLYLVMRKGKIGENQINDILSDHFPDDVIELTAQKDFESDIQLNTPEGIKKASCLAKDVRKIV